MSSNLESQFLTKLDSKILKIQTIAKFSIDKHVDKIKSKQVNIDAKLNKKSKKQLKEESFINPEKIKQETGVNPNLDTYSADRIQKCNKWITYWAKQEQFKNLPNLKLDIKSNFGSLGTFLPPREAHKLEQRRMIEEDKSMTEAMESFRVKFEESKKYEEYGAFEFPDWKILDKEPTMEGLRNLYNSQFISPTGPCVNRVIQEVKDLVKDRKAREIYKNKNQWPKIEKQVPGLLKSYNASFGFGFVQTEKHENVFIHVSGFLNSKRHPGLLNIEKASRFVKGQRLKIDVIKTPTNKLEAINAVPDVETYGCPHLLEDFRITYQDQKIDLSKTDKYEVTLPNPGKILSKNETWAVKVEGR